MEDNRRRSQTSLVQILGEECRARGTDGNTHHRRAAACVDARMRRAADQGPELPRNKVAVQVAIELAAELLAAQDDREQLLRSAADNLDRLSALVEQRSTLVPLTSERIRTRTWNPRSGAPAGRPAHGPRLN